MIVYSECPNYDLIIPVLLSDGVTALPEKCKLTAGIPLKPMLAQPTKCIDDIFQQFDGSNFTCEWKYDGERAQVNIGLNFLLYLSLWYRLLCITKFIHRHIFE